MILIQRVQEAEDITDCIRSSDQNTLPIAFADEDRDVIRRIIGSEVANLSPNAALKLPQEILKSETQSHLLLTDNSEPIANLAARYSAITKRPILLSGVASLSERLPKEAPHTLTWICPLEEMDIAEELRLIRSAFFTKFGKVPRIGILTGEDLTRLTWTLTKQLIPKRTQADSAMTILLNIEESIPKIPSATYIDDQFNSADAKQRLDQTQGTLFILGHSRPHCGRLEFNGEELGICGLDSGGEDKHCVDGVVCHFADHPKFVAHQSQASRIYYDGCSTGKVGGHRVGLFGLPRNSMLSHAFLKSAAREYIGNLHAGSFGFADVHWLIGLSSLGYSPAECVQLIDISRSRSATHMLNLGVYFGDATNPPWPADGVSVAEVRDTSAGVHISWPTSAGVLIAKVKEKSWADLMQKDLLRVLTDHESNPQISLLKDPWTDATVVLAIPRIHLANSSPLVVELHKLKTAVPSVIGESLATTVENIEWLAKLPSFQKTMTVVGHKLETQLIKLRRSVFQREDYALLPDLARFAEQSCADMVRQSDQFLISEALTRSQTRWEFLEEYEQRSFFEQLDSHANCNNCGSSTLVTDHIDCQMVKFERTISTCSNCGICADLPKWLLDVSLHGDSLCWNGNTLVGSGQVHNGDNKTRTFALGATLVGAGQLGNASSVDYTGVVEPGSTNKFEFSVIHNQTLTGTMRFRVFIASEGGFGFVGGILLVQPN